MPAKLAILRLVSVHMLIQQRYSRMLNSEGVVATVTGTSAITQLPCGAR